MHLVGAASHLAHISSVPLPTRVGKIYIDPRYDDWHYLVARRYDRDAELAAIARAVRPGSICFDVGAHLGEYAIALAKATGPSGSVIAFEPNPRLVRNLRRTLDSSRFRVLDVALSDRPGAGSLYVPRYASMAAITPWAPDPTLSVVPIRVTTLDTLIAEGIPVPSFIKCDAEGAEARIFRGGSMLLRAHRPALQFEAGTRALRAVSGATEEDLLALLRSFGYRVFEPIGRRVLDGTGDSLQNYLATPD